MRSGPRAVMRLLGLRRVRRRWARCAITSRLRCPRAIPTGSPGPSRLTTTRGCDEVLREVTAVVDVTGIPGKSRANCEPAAYLPVVIAAREAGYPPLWWGHKPVKVGRVLGLEDLYPSDRRLPGELRERGGGALVAKMGLKDDIFGRRLWNFARRHGWLGFSVYITYPSQYVKTDRRGNRWVPLVTGLKEISAKLEPATYKNYVMNREAA